MSALSCLGRRRRRLVLGGAALLAGLASGTPLRATTRLAQKRILPYPVDYVWPATIRYLRVDRGYEIVDRDEDIGYVVFDMPLGGDRTGRGSVELVRQEDAAGRQVVQVTVATDGGPTHLPFTLLEGIAAKVKAERGQPPPPPPKPTEPPAEPKPPNDHEIPTIPPGGPPPILRPEDASASQD